MGSTKTEHRHVKSDCRTFVLVHGGFHGGWCYARVAEQLRAYGHRAFTPTLTGLGERSHLANPAINCSLHIQDVLNVLRWERLHDVVLCGHSYGGMVIAGVADAACDLIDSLVFLDASISENGKCALDLMDESDRSVLLQMVATQGGEFLSPFPAALLNVNRSDQDMVNALCTPQPFATLTERMVLKGEYLKVRKKIYVRATNWNGKMLERSYLQIKNATDWEVFEIASGHDSNARRT